MISSALRLVLCDSDLCSAAAAARDLRMGCPGIEGLPFCRQPHVGLFSGRDIGSRRRAKLRTGRQVNFNPNSAQRACGRVLDRTYEGV